MNASPCDDRIGENDAVLEPRIPLDDGPGTYLAESFLFRPWIDHRSLAGVD